MDPDVDKVTDQIVPETPAENIDQLAKNLDENTDKTKDMNSSKKKDGLIEIPDENSDVQKDALLNEKTDMQKDTLVKEKTDVKKDALVSEERDVQKDTLVNEKTDVQKDVLVSEKTDVQKDTVVIEKTAFGWDQPVKLLDELVALVCDQPDKHSDELAALGCDQPDKLSDELVALVCDQPDKHSDELAALGCVQPDKLSDELVGLNQPGKIADDTDDKKTLDPVEPNQNADENIGQAQPDKSTVENTVPDPDQPHKTLNENIVLVQDQSGKTTDENPDPCTDQPMKSTDENTDIVPVLDQPDKTCNKNTEKMDIDVEEVSIKEAKLTRKRSIELDSDMKGGAVPSKRHAGLIPLCFEEDYDSTAETVIMTFEEAKEFLIKKVTECINSPVNPLYALQQRAEDLRKELAAKVAEYKKLCQGYQKLHENQEKFLRHAGLLPKVSMNSVSVSVDLPVLASSIPRNVNLPKAVQQSVLNNKELIITRLDNRTTANTSQTSTPSKTTTMSSGKSSDIECIDLTDDADVAPTNNMRNSNVLLTVLKHPAPLPPRPVTRSNQPFPPKPSLKISSEEKGIILQWDFPRFSRQLPAPISRFEIFGYQEMKTVPINTLLWKKIGNVDAMSLPMACTLTQFAEGSRYHFTIRAVDVKGEYSHYSDITSITYTRKTPAVK